MFKYNDFFGIFKKTIGVFVNKMTGLFVPIL